MARSNYDIYNNLLLNGGLKLREGFRRHAWNNVIPSTTAFIRTFGMTTARTRCTATSLRWRHRPARMSTPYVKGNDGRWQPVHIAGPEHEDVSEQVGLG